MMEIQQIYRAGLLGDQGKDLSLAANRHLFDWPGELVYGDYQPEASDEVDNFEDPTDVTDWARKRYRQVEGEGQQFPDRFSQSSTPIPPLTLTDLRQQHGEGAKGRESGPTPYDSEFARPTQAMAFEARQVQQHPQSIDNEFLRNLGLSSFSQDFPAAQSEEFKWVDYSGARWLLAEVSKQAVGVCIISDRILNAVGPKCSGEMLKVAILDFWNDDSQRLHHILDQTHGNLMKMQELADKKLQQIETELFAWLERGSLPVIAPDGTQDQSLSIANLATALIGARAMALYGLDILSFKFTAEDAFRGLAN